VSTAPAFASETDALRMLDSVLGYLTAADPAQMPTVIQARCLTALERADARATAARAAILAAFTATKGYRDDGDYGPSSWLINQTHVTKATAGDHTGWSRRTQTHPRILAGLAAEIHARSRPDVPDEDGPRFEDRAVRLETTFGGAGVMTGDLSPECAAVVSAVLDALSAPRGAEDDRSHLQRYHDALEEACRRLVAAGLLPERAGQPVKVTAHIHLKDLIGLDISSKLQEEWTENVRGQWAAARAAASLGGSDGAAWMEGEAAEGFACDALVTPVVFGTVNPGVMEELVRFCVQLAGHGPGRCTPAPGPSPCRDEPAPSDPDPDRAASDHASPDLAGPGEPMPGPQPLPPGLSRESLEQEIIGRAIALLSGPDGLASFLRRRELGVRLGGPSQPLDIGYSDNVPAGIRNAVKARDRFCQWAGGCDQPASACEVHHLRHKGHGGETSLDNCIMICFFHHQVMIHRMGWTLVRNPDGTTTAWNRDRSKVLRSHSPPARAG